MSEGAQPGTRSAAKGSAVMTHTLSIADRVGLGIAAGLIGTIVMTLGQKAEMALTGRSPSATPAKAVEKVADVELDSDADKQRASTPVHFAYGTALGGLLGVMDDVPEPARTAGFFALAWGSGAALLTLLKFAPPPWQQEPADVTTDVGHHLVYAASTGVAYGLLTRMARA